MTTRYPSGINNAENMSSLSNMGQLDPFKFQTIADDFFALSTDWLVVETQAGATQAVAAGAGGRLLLTNSAAIGDVNALSTQVASFRIVAGKKFFAKCRISVSDVTNTIITMGLGNAATTMLPANGIYVSKTGILVSVTNANTSALTTTTFTDVSGLALNQFCTLGLEYDGKSLNLYYGQESTANPAPDRKVASVDAPNLNTAVDLVGFVGIKNVNAAANTGLLDYVVFAMER